jgi:uncharacterized membrane protein YqjE
MTDLGPQTTGDGTASGSGLTSQIPADARLMDLVGRMSSDVTHIVRAELELAKVEIKDEVARTALGAGLLSGTALAGYFVLLMLSFAAAFGLAEIMAAGWAFLIVGLFYGVVAGTLFVLGRKKLATVTLVPKKTVQTLREDLSWLKQRMS